MNFKSRMFFVVLISVFTFLPFQNIASGGLVAPTVFISDTDSNSSRGSSFDVLVYFFDLRERETFIQYTYPDRLNTGVVATAHVQIFNVADNCNENDFFDVYTINDTHTYNMRDIVTNDGNPSGVVLPEGAYGIVAISSQILPEDQRSFGIPGAFGNVRVIDNNGYEYRSNAQNILNTESAGNPSDPDFSYYFNFNSEAGVTLSDIVGINLLSIDISVEQFDEIFEFNASDVANTYTAFDVDIYDLNEVPFSCRDIIFSCVHQDHPRLEELLENAQVASVASFEYGINEAIPHSKNGELLCPGNNISDGFVNLKVEGWPESVLETNSSNGASFARPFFYGFVGLNNGNSRGSLDSLWVSSPVGFL